MARRFGIDRAGAARCLIAGPDPHPLCCFLGERGTCLPWKQAWHVYNFPSRLCTAWLYAEKFPLDRKNESENKSTDSSRSAVASTPVRPLLESQRVAEWYLTGWLVSPVRSLAHSFEKLLAQFVPIYFDVFASAGARLAVWETQRKTASASRAPLHTLDAPLPGKIWNLWNLASNC